MESEKINETLHKWYRRGQEHYHEKRPKDKAHPNTLKGMLQTMGWVLEDNRHGLSVAKAELKKHGKLLIEGEIMTVAEYEYIVASQR